MKKGIKIMRAEVSQSVLIVRYVFIIMLFVFIGFTSVSDTYGQNRIQNISNQLNSIDSIAPGLNDIVSFTVSNVPIQELVRNLAKINKLNITIDPSINIGVTNNFAEVRAKELIVFLCKHYDLTIDITGSIISISKYVLPEIPPDPYVPKTPKVKYDKDKDLLSLDLKNDSLYLVAKEITEQSGKNVIYAPGLQDRRVSSYINNSPFVISLEKFALANNMSVDNDEGFFVLNEAIESSPAKGTSKGRNSKNSKNENDEIIEVRVNNSSDFSVVANNASLENVLSAVSDQININYFLYSGLEGECDIKVDHISYPDFLEKLLNGSKYTFNYLNGIYLIGESNQEKLRETRVIQLKSRTVIEITSIIPSGLSDGVEIKEFPDLNSLIISGASKTIEELEGFISDIDVVVPVILIEVMIVDSRSSYNISTGITAGLTSETVETSGTILPSVDVTLSSESINKLISSFNGFGWFNLGKVSPNFYMSLKALESDGMVKLRSTPKLSTLNGYEATLSIGNTEYYLEETNSVVGTQNPQNIQSQQYKPVQADFTLKINPIVSGNEQITLNIEVIQSDFTERISKEAPPGSITRSFTSLIRIKNEEMVLLGGLEEKKVSESSSGLPLLSRIPILKWLFSSRSKENSFDKLNVFIKPTVIY